MALTFKQIVLAVLGYRLIPQDYIVPIERDGQVVRLVGPGYVRKNPFTERYGRRVRTGFGMKQLALGIVRSADGDSVGIQVKLLYTFNPRKCEEKMALALVQDGVDETLELIIRDEGEKAIRHTIGGFKTEELRCGKFLENLERSIGRRLRHVLAQFGVTPITPNWVAITRISLPDSLEKAYESTAEQKINAEAQKVAAESQKEVADAWAAMSSEGARLMVLADIYEKMSQGKNSFQVIAGSPSELFTVPFQLLEHRMAVPVKGHQNGKSSTES